MTPAVACAVLTVLVSAATPRALVAQWAPRTGFPEGGATIDRVLLHYDDELAADLRVTFRDLLRALPREVRVDVAVESESDWSSFVAEMGAVVTQRSRVAPALVGERLTAWARDRTLVLRGDEDVALLAPRGVDAGTPYAGDLAVGQALQTRDPELRASWSALRFEGGNIAFSGERVFVGADLVDANLDALEGPDPLVVLREEFGRHAVAIGYPAPPHEHLDMYFTVLGDVVLLGDPEAGARLLVAEPGELPTFDEWCADVQYDYVETYDRIARQLRVEGVAVRRVPVIHGISGGVLTWNNALVEERDGELRAYVPVYGVASLDAAALAAFRAAGCRPFPIRVAAIAGSGGTVRCLTNVLDWHRPDDRRRPAATRRPVRIPNSWPADELGWSSLSPDVFTQKD